MKAFKLFAALTFFMFSFVIVQMAFAQVSSPAPVASASPAIVAAAPVVAQGGFWGWVMAHGGLQASVLLLVACFNIVVTAARDVLCKVDGVNLANGVPPDKTKLTLLNKIALASGTVLDWLTANIQHK